MKTTFLSMFIIDAVSAASHCSAPVWEGGNLLSTAEACLLRNLKGAWCQHNPSNCATCSGIWCDAAGEETVLVAGGNNDNGSPGNKVSASSSNGGVTTSAIEHGNDLGGHNNGANDASASATVCTGRPDLDALLARSNIAEVSQITASGVYTWSGSAVQCA